MRGLVTKSTWPPQPLRAKGGGWLRGSKTSTRDPHQNPLYPDDKDLTPDEMYAMARERSMVRAHSPGELRCVIDSTSTLDVPIATHDTAHGYQELMNYRHAHVIGDQDPWTYWLLYDQWAAAQAPVIPPPVPPSPLPTGWHARAQVKGYTPGSTGGWTWNANWNGYTFAVHIGPGGAISVGAGAPPTQVRVRLRIMGRLDSLYIGPASAVPGGRWRLS